MDKYQVVDCNLKVLKTFKTIRGARDYIKKNSPKDPKYRYGIYELDLEKYL